MSFSAIIAGSLKKKNHPRNKIYFPFSNGPFLSRFFIFYYDILAALYTFTYYVRIDIQNTRNLFFRIIRYFGTLNSWSILFFLISVFSFFNETVFFIYQIFTNGKYLITFLKKQCYFLLRNYRFTKI